MIKYVLRRLLHSIPIFFGITVLSYALIGSTPGGPVSALTFRPGVTPADRQQLAIRLGVNDPWPVQYLRWLTGDDWMRWDSDGDGIADQSVILPLDVDGDGEPEPPGERLGVLRGDFGMSFTQRQKTAMEVILDRLPATLELGIASLLLGTITGVAIGVTAAVRRGWFDSVSRVLAVIFDAVPGFWLALMLILFFGVTLDLLPLQQRCAPSMDDSCPPLFERLEYLVLPTFVIASGLIAGYSRFARASMLDVINQDYIRTAQSKGLSNRFIWFRHGARNALIPIATFLGPSITDIIAGAVITETVFSWNGVGQVTFKAALQRDYPVVMATTVLAALATIFGYLLSYILYGIIDPRIRFD